MNNLAATFLGEDFSGLGQRAVHNALGGSLDPQIAHPQLQNRLVARFNIRESDTHSFCMSGDHMAEGHDFGACMNDGDPDLRPGIRGCWGRHKTAMDA